MTIDDLFIDGTFSSFADLVSKFKLPNTHLFRFFQIRHYVKSCFPHFPNRPPEPLLDQFLILNTKRKGLIGTIYNYIHRLSPNRLNSLRAAWGQDLGIPLPDEQWEKILYSVHSSSICARHNLLQCKILHRVYLTNAKLAKIYPDRTDTCNRCRQSPADLAHMFLTCPLLSDFWTAIFETISKVVGQTIVLEPLTAFFGISSSLNVPKSTRKIIAFSTLLARRLILLKWSHSTPPIHNKWIQEVLRCVTIEKIRFSLKGSLDTFYKTWQPFLVYIDSLNIVAESS